MEWMRMEKKANQTQRVRIKEKDQSQCFPMPLPKQEKVFKQQSQLKPRSLHRSLAQSLNPQSKLQQSQHKKQRIKQLHLNRLSLLKKSSRHPLLLLRWRRQKRQTLQLLQRRQKVTRKRNPRKQKLMCRGIFLPIQHQYSSASLSSLPALLCSASLHEQLALKKKTETANRSSTRSGLG